jgi:hypothetical protein
MSGGGRSRRRRYRGPAYRGTIDEGRWIADEEESPAITGSTVHNLEVSEVFGSAAAADVDVGFEDNTGSPLPDNVEARGGGRAVEARRANSAPEDRDEPGKE